MKSSPSVFLSVLLSAVRIICTHCRVSTLVAKYSLPTCRCVRDTFKDAPISLPGLNKNKLLSKSNVENQSQNACCPTIRSSLFRSYISGAPHSLWVNLLFAYRQTTGHWIEVLNTGVRGQTVYQQIPKSLPADCCHCPGISWRSPDGVPVASRRSTVCV